MEKTHACLASSIESSAVDISVPAPVHTVLRRVQHHALTSPSALAPWRGERVAWPTVPADGSPHLHSVPSDADSARRRDAGLPRREPTGP